MRHTPHTRMVQKITKSEKAQMFGMLDRIEKVVNDSYCREAMPKLVHSIPVAKVAAPAVEVSPKVAILPERGNIIDVAALAGQKHKVFDFEVQKEPQVEPIKAFPEGFDKYFEFVDSSDDQVSA